MVISFYLQFTVSVSFHFNDNRCVEDIVFDCEAFLPFFVVKYNTGECICVCVSWASQCGIIKEIRQNAGLIVYLRVLLAGPVRRNQSKILVYSMYCLLTRATDQNRATCDH